MPAATPHCTCSDRGQIPLLELEVLRALRRRGGLDRALAEMLHAATGGEIR